MSSAADNRGEQPPGQQPPPQRGVPDQGLIATLRERAQMNGWAWVGLQLLDWLAHRSSDFFQRRMRALERSRGLTGLHTREQNRRQWNSYDWSGGGEEWSLGPEWRAALIEEVMVPNVPTGSTSLEIGPGAGRWSGALLEASERLVLSDIAEEPIELCRQKFGDRPEVAYHVTDGASLTAVDSDSIDFVWSFDVFVHIAPDDQRGYLREFARVMRPGGRGVVHHAGRGGLEGGWRSSMTAERFRELLEESDFELVRQFDSWGPAGSFSVPIPGDVISVFEPRG